VAIRMKETLVRRPTTGCGDERYEITGRSPS
jgi:hypothetical protein